ncbi:MAG: hypothetical protein PIR02_17200 [Microbacterium enclense]
MSQHHLVTHAYDSHTGWVRIARTEMTHESAEDLRDQGYTMVRLRRGVFGSRDVSLSRYTAEDAALDVEHAAVEPAEITLRTGDDQKRPDDAMSAEGAPVAAIRIADPGPTPLIPASPSSRSSSPSAA